MHPRVFSGALLGAVIGALVWGAFSYFTNWEHAAIAWGIGLLVGFLTNFMGGRGTPAGILAAVCTILSIGAGKYLAIDWSIKGVLTESISVECTEELYQEELVDAGLFAQVTGPEGYPDFMVDRAYTEAQQASGVTAEDLRFFEAITVPHLRDLHAADPKPTFEEWKELRIKRFVAGIREEISYWDVIKSDLHPFDFIFVALGVFTAFKVAVGVGFHEPAAPVAEDFEDELGERGEEAHSDPREPPDPPRDRSS